MKCQAITQKGTQCSYNAKNGSFCGRHTPKASTSTADCPTSTSIVKKPEQVYDVMEIVRILKKRDENVVRLISDFLYKREDIETLLMKTPPSFYDYVGTSYSLMKNDDKKICYIVSKESCKDGNMFSYMEFKEATPEMEQLFPNIFSKKQNEIAPLFGYVNIYRGQFFHAKRLVFSKRFNCYVLEVLYGRDTKKGYSSKTIKQLPIVDTQTETTIVEAYMNTMEETHATKLRRYGEDWGWSI
jgi:hypothetical protein